MLSHKIVRQACESLTLPQYRDVLVEFVEHNSKFDACVLMNRLLLAFEVNIVHDVVEHIKSIVWAIVRIVYARNRNLLSFNRHVQHMGYAATIIPKIANSKKLYDFSRLLYKRHCVYEMREDCVSFEYVIKLLCFFDDLFFTK